MSIIRTFIYDVAMVSPRYREQDGVQIFHNLWKICVLLTFPQLVEDFFEGRVQAIESFCIADRCFRKSICIWQFVPLNHDSMPHKSHYHIC